MHLRHVNSNALSQQYICSWNYEKVKKYCSPLSPGVVVVMYSVDHSVLCLFAMLLSESFHFRIMTLAQDYCVRRSVFGKLLVNHPLHMQTLARMEVTCFTCRLVYVVVNFLTQLIFIFFVVFGYGNAANEFETTEK